MLIKNGLLNIKKIIANFSEKKKQTVSGFNATQKFLFNSFHLLLSLYITLTQFSLVIFDLIPHVLLAVSSVVLFFVVYIGLFYLCDAIGKISIYYTPERKKFDFKFALIVFLVVEVVVMLLFFSETPGRAYPDTRTHWRQITTGVFDDWHPAIYTFTLLLITKIKFDYTAILFVQCVVFGIAVAYLLATIERFGISKKIIYGILALTLINQNTHVMLMTAIKDTAFSLTLVFLATYLINIYYSEGEWLKKPLNIIAFCLALTYATLIRHNGLLFTVPLVIILLLFFEKCRKQSVCCIAIVLMMIALVRGPLYSAFDVQKDLHQHQTSSEIIGMPMTILADIMVTNAEALDPEAKEFLNLATSEQGWIDMYEKGSFNSVKFREDLVHIWLYTDNIDIFRMTIKSALNAMTIAINAVIELTDMVWATTGTPEGSLDFETSFFDVRTYPEIAIPLDLNTPVQQTAKGIYNMVFEFVPNFLYEALSFLGIHFLVIMIFGFYACSPKYNKKSVKALLFVLPIILYNVGTMVVLCGNDYRFFHFNLLLSAPLVLVFIAKEKRTKT